MSRLESIERKIMTLEALSSLREGWRIKGLKTVFTNGVFDIVHRGHVTLLARAADFGDRLIVAVNADASVRALGKGGNRPVNAQADRAAVIAAMGPVDAVVIFDAHTPYELIKALEPDVLVKGGDYDPEQRDTRAKNYLVGSDLQRQRGKETVVISIVEGYSTTSIIEKSTRGKN
ncbi:MAG: adenylyltransferase/cytidyltransferase family protein [Cryomorphaceae bacterium]